MAASTPPGRTPPPPEVPPQPAPATEASAGDRPPWPPIRPLETGGSRRDRRRPLRPRQIVLAVIVALGFGALLGSGALVGLAERQPLGTQRDVALGAAKVADRLAHGLSLNRPAERLAAELDGTEEVYDVEALIARARAAAATVTEPPPPPPAAAPAEVPVAPPAGPAGTAPDEPAGATGTDPEAGPPADGLITPIEGIDCVPLEAAATTTGAPGPEGADQGEAAPDGAAGPEAADQGETAPDGAEDPEAADHGETAPDGAEDPAGPGQGEAAPDGAEGPSPADATGADRAEPADPTDCPPGYVAAGTAPGEPDPAGDPGEEPSEPIGFEAPRTPDEDRPLVMYVGGDSISRDLGEGLARVTPAELVRIDLDPRPATGLSRPDFFDWAQHLAGVLTESLPDVIVVLFGANDFQNVEHEDRILDRFGDEWLELYRERVDRIMTLLSQPDVQTVWVGQPPVREPRLSGGLERLNTVYAETAARHPQVTYIDTWALFSDADGDYADEIDGVRLRREDGVHLTVAGGNHLAGAVWDVIAPAWGLE